MVKYSDAELDSVFTALAHPTRRAVLDTLDRGSQPVSELAQPHAMSLPGFMKHLRVLEDAGLITRSKEGRVVSCGLDALPMKQASAWMSRYEKFWTEKLDSLARYLYQQEELQLWKQPISKPSPRSPLSAATPPRRKGSGGRGPTRRR